MKRRRVAVVVLVSVSTIVFGTIWGTSLGHHDHIATPQEIAAYEKAVCDGLNPPPLKVGDGKWIVSSCDVNGA
jgi:hypothetical protein